MRPFILCTFLATCFLTMLSSCNSPQKEVSESSSFKNIRYYLRYMQANKELQVDVNFKADTAVRINGPVLLNGKKMPLKRIPGIALLYRSVLKPVLLDTLYTFECQLKANTMYKETITVPAFKNVRLDKKTISQDNGGGFIWEGSNLTKNDALLIIYTDATGKTFKQNHIGGTVGNRLPFKGKQLAQFALGEGSILVIRKRTTVQRKQQTTIIKTSEIYSQPIPFELK
jgi:hypothetical protein